LQQQKANFKSLFHHSMKLLIFIFTLVTSLYAGHIFVDPIVPNAQTISKESSTSVLLTLNFYLETSLYAGEYIRVAYPLLFTEETLDTN